MRERAGVGVNKLCLDRIKIRANPDKPSGPGGAVRVCDPLDAGAMLVSRDVVSDGRWIFLPEDECRTLV